MAGKFDAIPGQLELFPEVPRLAIEPADRSDTRRGRRPGRRCRCNAPLLIVGHEDRCSRCGEVLIYGMTGPER